MNLLIPFFPIWKNSFAYLFIILLTYSYKIRSFKDNYIDQKQICYDKFLFDIKIDISDRTFTFLLFRNNIENITKFIAYSKDICYRLENFITKINNNNYKTIDLSSCKDLLYNRVILYENDLTIDTKYCLPLNFGYGDLDNSFKNSNNQYYYKEETLSIYSVSFIITNTPSCPYLANILASYNHLNENECIKIFQPSLYQSEDNKFDLESNSNSNSKKFCNIFKQYSNDKYALEKIIIEENIDINILKNNRILCVIYTIESRHDAIIAIVDTWGKNCTGFLAFSNVEDLSIPTIHIKHDGEESYGNIWRKIVSIIKYIYNNYYNDFDWFLFAGDDTYFIMNNLLHYLSSDDVWKVRNKNNGIFIGRQFKLDNSNYTYNTGGGGYILDNISLESLYNGITSSSDICNSNIETSVEDVYVSNCLRHCNIYPYDTRDEFSLERFHHFSPEVSWFYNPITPIELDWWASHMIDFKNGSDCCSSNSISFHKLQPNHMRAIDSYFYLCR